MPNAAVAHDPMGNSSAWDHCTPVPRCFPRICHRFCPPVGTRDASRPDVRLHFGGLDIHHSYEALLSDPRIDAVYIATPHAFHAESAIAAARHSKQVLCEKPLALSSKDVVAMFSAAEKAGTFLGEALMYRLHPLASCITEQLKSGRIGDVRLIKSSFGFAAKGAGPNHRLLAREIALRTRLHGSTAIRGMKV